MTKESPLISQLNAPTPEERLDALRTLKASAPAREGGSAPGRDVNNHIHTTYSFSPYSPTKAVWMSYKAGLATAGIMDHDSIAGAREFIEAGKIMGLPTTIGAELRACFAYTPLKGRRINNPDQSTVAYVAMHGVPHSRIDALAEFFDPIRKARDLRNRQMTDNLNRTIASAGVSIDYDADVVTISEWKYGGEITERHILYAVANKLIGRFGIGADLVAFLRQKLALPVSDKVEAKLTDASNPFADYDLLGVLKGNLVEKFYIDATKECPAISEVAEFTKENGIVLAYAYLGDVTASVTGDKKAQTFEEIKRIGFNAVTYMPSRNTREQLERVRALCDKHGLFQISGEDINQPSQEFICKAMRDPFFANLYDAAWALIGHELLASGELSKGMFSEETKRIHPDLTERIAYYRDAAKSKF